MDVIEQVRTTFYKLTHNTGRTLLERKKRNVYAF